MALQITGAISSYYDFPKLMISGDEHTNYTIVLMINQDGTGNGLVTTEPIWDSNKELFCSTGKWNIDEFRDYNEILTIKNK